MSLKRIESLFFSNYDAASPAGGGLAALAGLANHSGLTKTLDIAIKSNIISALELLEARKFEEAFAKLLAAYAIVEIEETFRAARDELKSQNSLLEKKENDGKIIKY